MSILNLQSLKFKTINSGGIRISMTGRKPKGFCASLLFWPFFSEDCIIMKKWIEKGRVPGTHLDPPIIKYFEKLTKNNIICEDFCHHFWSVQKYFVTKNMFTSLVFSLVLLRDSHKNLIYTA